jgi:hypothetical protein
VAINDPLYNEIDGTTLESVRKNVIFNNFFVQTAIMAKLRASGCLDPYLGGSAAMETFLYGRVQGQAVRPGQSVTIVRQPINSAMNFQEKAYVAWFPYDDWEMDDGSGQGGVINSGEARIVNLYQMIYESTTEMIETMLEMDMYRHGQSPTTGITDNRILNSNGIDEAFNNGIDPSPFGNVYQYYGGGLRQGVTGKALCSTPLYLGTPTGGTGQIDFNALMQLWAQCKLFGDPDLGITNVFGFVAIANALDAQRRDISNTKHDIKWDGLNFNGVDIYASPLAPSSQAANYLPLAAQSGVTGNVGGAANNTLVDGAGVSTQLVPFTSPQFTYNGANVAVSPTGSGIPSNTVIQPGEYLAFCVAGDFHLRPTDKPGWNMGIRKTQMPNNVSLDAVMVRQGTNLYNPMPRRGAIAYGFAR